MKTEKEVAYFYDEEIGNFCYGGGNPMRPHRARMTYSLVSSYGLTSKMMVHRPRARTFEELTEFHADGKELGGHAPCHLWLHDMFASISGRLYGGSVQRLFGVKRGRKDLCPHSAPLSPRRHGLVW